MNLYLRSDAKDNDNDGYLDKNAGLQTVPPEAQGSWGPGERLLSLGPTSRYPDMWQLPSWHLKEKSTTIGCVCDRSETVIDAVFNINSRETAEGSSCRYRRFPKSGDPNLAVCNLSGMRLPRCPNRNVRRDKLHEGEED